MKKDGLDLLKAQSNFRSKVFLLIFLFIFFFCFPNNIQAAPYTDSLLGYWKLDEGSASMPVLDSSGHSNIGSDIGAPSYYSNTPDLKFGNPDDQYCIEFNSPQSVSMGTTSNLKPTAIGSFSFSLWIKLTNYPASKVRIGGNHKSGLNSGFFFSISPAGIASFSIGDGSNLTSVSSSAAIPLEQWVHLLGIRDYNSSQIKIYVNGTSTSQVFTGTLNTTDTLFQIGNFNGRMDDVRLYKRVLTTTEITDLANGYHTSAIWTGNTSTDYEDTGNWNISAVPDPYTRVTIANTENLPELTANAALSKLIIDSNASLNLKSYNLTFNDSGSFSNNGTLKLLGTQTLNGFINDIDSGTIEFNNTSTLVNLAAGYNYNDLKINCSSTVTLGGNIDINGNLLLENGILTASSYNINLAGNWTNNGVTFFPNSSTVILDGGNQTITGSNTFYNLTKISPSTQLGFGASNTQTITGTLTLKGAAKQLLNLRSTQPGALNVSARQWIIDPRGTITISYLDVKDSKNINATAVNARNKNIIDSGNNTKWLFDVSNSLSDDSDDDDDDDDDDNDDDSSSSGSSSSISSSSSSRTTTTTSSSGTSSYVTKDSSDKTNATSLKNTPHAPSSPSPSFPDSESLKKISTDWQKRYFGNSYCYNESICGTAADPDNDGLRNLDEFRLGTDPNAADSDSDGTEDSTEFENGRNPAKATNDKEDDKIEFEDAKKNGSVVKEIFEVHNAELVEQEGKRKLKVNGKGLPNSYVTVYIYSELPTILTIKTDNDGNWSYILDKELEDGEHEVYVAVTDNTGKIKAKSDPLAFIKTAEAVTIIPPAEAASSASSSVEKRSFRDMAFFFFIGLIAFIVSLSAIGVIVRTVRRRNE